MDPQQIRELSILAGMDPSGGAGLMRDLWVCEELLGDRSVAALCTGLTRQGPGQKARLGARVGPAFARSLCALPDGVWKVGMLCPRGLGFLHEHLRERDQAPQIILDPVQKASAGGQIGAKPGALAKLWPHCSWVTPNRSEALALGASPGPSLAVDGAPWQLATSMRGCSAWWIKSVAADDAQIWDELHLDGEIFRLARAKDKGPDPRGTGCALSTALAIYCSQGFPVHSPAEKLWQWNQDRWKPLVELTGSTKLRLGPVLAASQWLAKARQNPVRAGKSWFLPGPAQK